MTLPETPDSSHPVPRGRFAPSPTGRMHAGNIYASLVTWLYCKQRGGEVVLRIEDLDPQRCKPAYAEQIMADYSMLGLGWDGPIMYQSTRTNVYCDAYNELGKRNRIYPCFCTRADLHAASAPHKGEKHVYPGTCRKLSPEEREARSQSRKPAWRIQVPERTIRLHDIFQGDYSQQLSEDCGDFLIRRSDGAYAYQLAVVVDDAAQGVNTVIRGVDLLCSTPQQIFLQQELGFDQPKYGHVPLLVERENRRLSKRDHDASLEQLLAQYGSARGVVGHIAHVAGLIPEFEPLTPEELLPRASFDNLHNLIQIAWQA
ncbi:glutamyl-Q tRNA(Asp) ligase [Denitrobacterium detoxificans]|uniref:Glutamyl-Q tRNA(Asp) synthetase n=1 Tax=Denitrobacterium detoxificans TaxID=79604 RepID=A0A172RY93_9ACTN|nr:tRNA glutamyl-Q(34) synthetase GluQRS [Denitrobacterium detoxificans]ANE22688.1 glutamyl-Q tRNA(Asp) ligase [Denitrobacterium detoxificans]SEO87260.1 glutamyl-tRNA synthetase [Denitrobacterium detoxificans]